MFTLLFSSLSSHRGEVSAYRHRGKDPANCTSKRRLFPTFCQIERVPAPICSNQKETLIDSFPPRHKEKERVKKNRLDRYPHSSQIKYHVPRHVFPDHPSILSHREAADRYFRLASIFARSALEQA